MDITPPIIFPALATAFPTAGNAVFIPLSRTPPSKVVTGEVVVVDEPIDVWETFSVNPTDEDETFDTTPNAVEPNFDAPFNAELNATNKPLSEVSPNNEFAIPEAELN